MGRKFQFSAMVILLCCGGCADLYTTTSIRINANSLAQQVQAYSQQQQARVTKLNTDYTNTYNRLIKELVSLESDQLSQDFQLDALRMTDQIVSDPNSALLRSRFRDSIQTTVINELTQIGQVDQAIANARNAYSDAYTQASLDFSKLKSVESSLSTLAESEDESKNIQTLVTKIYNAYQAVQKEEKQAPHLANK